MSHIFAEQETVQVILYQTDKSKYNEKDLPPNTGQEK